jgi:hypothetical protein
VFLFSSVFLIYPIAINSYPVDSFNHVNYNLP